MGSRLGLAQVAVDAKHKLIAADDVSNEVTDLNQLANVALEAKANLELSRAEVVADAGYYNASEVSRSVEQQITPYIPKADTSANTARGLYGKSQFKYDAARDVCRCPAGAELTYRFSTYELGRELQYYRASGCKTCALKSRCTRNKANRTITREANEHLMKAMATGCDNSRRSSSCGRRWPSIRSGRSSGGLATPTFC